MLGTSEILTGYRTWCILPGSDQKMGHDGLTKRMWNWFQYAAAALEVAVNEETGQVKIVKLQLQQIQVIQSTRRW